MMDLSSVLAMLDDEATQTRKRAETWRAKELEYREHKQYDHELVAYTRADVYEELAGRLERIAKHAREW